MFDLEFAGMGLFELEGEWIHPRRIEKSYEIIYVVSGEVNIREEDTYITAHKKDIIILPPNVAHWGFKKSSKTSFYWVHFMAENLDLEMPFFTGNFSNTYIFKELNHLSNMSREICPQYVLDTYVKYIVAQLIMSFRLNNNNQKVIDEIYEWVRVNVDAKLTVSKVAAHFGFNPEYISKMAKKHYGKGLKNIINIFLLDKAKDLLCNTNFYVTEIANTLGFSDCADFVNYFKYHEKMTPTNYRNLYSKTHMNRK